VRRGKRLKDPEKPCKLGKRSPAGQMTGKSSASSSLLRVHAVPCSLRRRYWEPVFEDSLDLIAKLPTIAATIYRCAACTAQRRGLVWPLCALACAAARHEGCLGSIPSLLGCLPALLQEHIQGGPACGGAPSAGLGRQPGAHDGWVGKGGRRRAWLLAGRGALAWSVACIAGGLAAAGTPHRAPPAGYEDEGCLEMMRLYQTIHADHEGGNVSAHATHLVRRSMGGGVAVPADGRLVHGACFQAMLFCGWLCQLMPDPGLRISRARSTPSPPPQLPGCPRWAPPSATLTCLSPLA
jgi:hypothetical protein